MNLMSWIEPTLGSLEEEYRLNFLKDDVRLSSIGIVLWVLFTISFAYNDYLFFGNVPQYWLLAVARTILVTYGIVLLFFLRKVAKVAIYERLILTFLMVGALFVFYVNTTRPSSYQMNVTLDVLVVFCLYLLFPNNVPFRILPAFLFSLSTILIAIFYRTFSVSAAMVTMFLSLILANSAGIIISARWNRLRRAWFKAVTESKRVEEDLRVREHQYRQLVENARDIIYQTDANGFFTLANPAAERVIGHSPEDLAGKNYLEIVHPEFRDQTGRFYGRQFVKRISDTYYECPVLARDGRVVWLGQHTRLLMDGDTIVGFQAVARDITDRKLAEEKIREQNEFLKIVLESLTYPFYVVNALDYTIEMANSAAGRSGIVQHATCYSATHGRTSPCTGLEHPCPAEEIKKTRQPLVAEHVHTMPTGETRHVEIHAYPIFDAEASVSRFIEYSLDVTDRKKAEELLLETARFRAVADLASGVAHNFNNLLQIVIGSANLAIMNLQSGKFSDMKENLERILDSSQLGAETVRRLNRFARTHVEGDASPITEVFDLSDLVSQAVEMTRPWWKTHPEKKGIGVDLKTTLEDGCMIEGRKNEIFELLVNLIKNATEALPNGGDVRIETRVESDRVIIGVQDTGVGIPEKDVDRVFTPFFTTSVEVGRGLGLATARKIVDEHGGRISVKSTEGQGTVFAVSLPLVRAISEMNAIPPTSIKDKPLTILVIDNMEAMVEMLRDGLEAFGHTAFTALSGEDGLAIFRDNPVDIVICDLGMPGINGWEVGKAIKDFCLERQIPKPPFVILTGWSDQSGETEKIVESGVDQVIQKPIDMSRLLADISPLVQTG